MTKNILNIFKDTSGNIVIAQRPNPPLMAAITFFILSSITTGQLQSIFHWGFTITLSYWAILEITAGVNLWRRLLGASVFIILVIQPMT